MRCKECQHSLWKVTARQCPACDRAFKPSDYRFRPETVRFCCPHCSQGYIGRGADGFPDPRRFACAFCGKPIDADEMVLEPAEGIEDHQTEPDAIPWIEEHRPWSARWARTAWLALANPSRLIELTPRDLPARPAVVFMLGTQGLLAAGLVALVFALGVVLSLPGGATAFGALTGQGLLRLVLTLAGTMLFTGVWIAVIHATARRNGHEASLAQTVHAVCFTSTPHALWYLPVLGPFVGWIGTLVWVRSVVGALAATHTMPTKAAWRTAGEWPAACLLLTIVVWGASSAGLIGGHRSSEALWFVSDAQSVSRLEKPLLGSAIHRDRVPTYIGELMIDGRLKPGQFLAPGSHTTLAGIEIAGITLEQFEQLAPARRLAVVQQAAGQLSPNTPSHRLGDFVFVLDVLALEVETPGLWVVIEAWDPGLNETGGLVHVLHADGSVRSMQGSAMPPALDEQNTLRLRVGLPTLPDPRSLRHDLVAGGEG